MRSLEPLRRLTRIIGQGEPCAAFAELIGHERNVAKVTPYFQNAGETIEIIFPRILPPLVQKVFREMFKTSLALCL